MIEKVVYTNHLGESVRMDGSSGIFCNAGDLRDFTYSVTTKNNRISNFGKGVVKKTLPVVIACTDVEAGTVIRNRLFEVMEKDILTGKHGRIIIGDYYLRCFVTGSAKTDYFIYKGYIKLSLSVTTDLPEWIRETVFTFGYGKGSPGKNLDFNRDFPSDYTSNLMGRSVCNKGFMPVHFRMKVYGVAENPALTVGGHRYQVDALLQRNEYLTVDSVNRTIVQTHMDGSTENLFNHRNRESYIFEKIPSGISLVSLGGCQKADITLLEERSEPEWT